MYINEAKTDLAQSYVFQISSSKAGLRAIFLATDVRQQTPQNAPEVQLSINETKEIPYNRSTNSAAFCAIQ